MEKLLLHICCAPCSTYPLKVLESEAFDVFGFFFNPNIHPYQEYEKRRIAVCDYLQAQNVPLILRDEYGLVNFLRDVVYREQNRCRICYFKRLEAAAETAVRSKLNYFTTTLLYSRFQQHDLIREIGESLARLYGVAFYYRDFREGWKEGIRLSTKAGLYRQQYCGCIYSEQERFDRRHMKR
jgi:hypothetical protein